MMTLNHVGNQETMVYAQLGQQPLVRTTVTSLQPRQGTRYCLSAQPPDLATATAAQAEVACVRPSIVLFLYSKRTAVTRSPGSRHPGVVGTKVGYFGSNLLKCPRGRWAPNLLKSVAWPPVC